MKILMLQTGGTIGSEDKNGVIGTAGASLTELCPQDDVIIIPEKVYTILSEELSPRHWERLIARIRSALCEGYDGIIITHGSDTLSYTSAMLGLCFGSSDIPVVITAANYVPDDPRSNARANINAAVTLIKNVSSGVYTVYKNDNCRSAQVWLPTRMIEADRFRDMFSSRDGRELAQIDEDGTVRIINEDILKDGLSLKGKHVSTDNISFRGRVMLFAPYPGISYDTEIPDDVRAVLHVSYHSGTVSSEAEKLLSACRERGIPFYICSVKRSAASLYETTHRLLACGAVPLYDITTEAALAKLTLAVNMPPEDGKKLLGSTVYYE